MPAAYVIKTEELTALNYLAADDPRPQEVEWINRGNDKPLKPSSVETLLRTLHLDVASESLVRLHRSTGLRAVFRTDLERDRFAMAFASAKEQRSNWALHVVTASFDDRKLALEAMAALNSSGIPQKSISLLSQASQFLDREYEAPAGHGTLSIVASVAGGGLAGVIFGMAVMVVPGLGIAAIVGAMEVSAISAFTMFSGIAGATGAAIAKMLTDHDVDGVTASYFAREFRRGKIFVSVDTRVADVQRNLAWSILKKHGGRAVSAG